MRWVWESHCGLVLRAQKWELGLQASFSYRLCHWLSMWPWASYPAYLCFSFVVCKMGIQCSLSYLNLIFPKHFVKLNRISLSMCINYIEQTVNYPKLFHGIHKMNTVLSQCLPIPSQWKKWDVFEDLSREDAVLVQSITSILPIICSNSHSR